MKKILTKEEIKRLDEKLVDASIAAHAAYHHLNQITHELNESTSQEPFKIKEVLLKVLGQIEDCKVELLDYKNRISD